MKAEKLDIVIVGDGILGSMAAYLISIHPEYTGRQVTVFYKKGNTDISSVGASAIGHSGLLFMFWDTLMNGRSRTSYRVKSSIAEMKNIWPEPFKGRGVVDLNHYGDIKKFDEILLKNNFKSSVYRMSNIEEIKKRIGGPLISNGGLYYSSSDCSFEIDEFINFLQSQTLLNNNVNYVPLYSGLTPFKGEDGEMRLSTCIGEFEYNYLLLSAGKATDQLLRPYGISSKIRTGRMFQIRIPNLPKYGMKCSVYYKFMSDGIPEEVIVAHKDIGSSGNGYLILSSGHLSSQSNPTTKLSSNEINRLLKVYKNDFHHAIKNVNDTDCNYCDLSYGSKKFSELIEHFVEKRLSYGVPGLGSNAYSAATELISRIPHLENIGQIKNMSQLEDLDEKKMWFKK